MTEQRDAAPTSSHAAFVVKLWIGDDESEQNRMHAWRGQIQHVQTGQSCVFRGPFQMLAFMDRFLVPRDGTTE